MDDSAGGTVNVFKVSGTSESQYDILTGNANFNELSIGDLLTISSMPKALNNGTFLITGVSDNGKNIRVLNPDAENQFSTATYTFVTNSTAGDTFTIGGTPLIAGTNFAIGGTAADTAANLSAVIGTISGVTSTVNGNIVTITGTISGQTTTIVYSGVGTVTVSSATLVGTTFVSGNFSASSQISEGDTVIIGSPFSALNQG